MKAPLLAHLWDRHPDDWYVEPPWCSERLFEAEVFTGNILDPACGMGTIVLNAERYGYEAFGSDLVRRADLWLTPIEERDFLADDDRQWNNIVSNPPFSLCSARDGSFPFVSRCLERARDKVALLMPAKWLFGAKRAEKLRQTPLAKIYCITPRPSMPPGPVIAAGEKPGNGTADFVWMIWQHGYVGQPTVAWLNRDDGR
jgi:hypothetical protein